ncbi:MAG: DUF4363 family protein [Clostridiales bacterium]|nr:DUF4363 family protein [Clostridiales bacterium]
MVKSIYSVIIAFLIFVFIGIGEQIYMEKTFEILEESYTAVYEKMQDETANRNDVEKVKNLWLEKKKYLHFFIPHNDIKEMDLWLAEAVAYFNLDNLEEAISKLEVAITLTRQLPKNYKISIENIF